MDRYTIYCTDEQVQMAIKLGAPCLTPTDYYPERYPTAEQMCGWLRSKGIKNVIHASNDKWYNEWSGRYMYDTYEEAVLDAITESLKYLVKNH